MSTGSSNPYKPPEAPLLETYHGAPGKALATALTAIGIAMVIYWGAHFAWHLQHWGLYAQQAVHVDPRLGPFLRAAIDISAVVAGMLMIRKSRWLLVAFVIHCIAFMTFVLAVSGGYLSLLSTFPLDIKLTFLAQLVSAIVVLVWFVKGLRRRV